MPDFLGRGFCSKPVLEHVVLDALAAIPLSGGRTSGIYYRPVLLSVGWKTRDDRVIAVS